MESVAVGSSAASGLDNFKHRESSPIANKENSPTIKKQNIRKRTKTGCLSRFYSFQLSIMYESPDADLEL